MSEMHTITIRGDSPQAGKEHDLASFLGLLGDEGERATWRVRFVECVGPLSDRLHAASNSHKVLLGSDLRAISRGIIQVVDGEFRAYAGGEVRAWLVLKAVDSTSWDVATQREDVLNRFKSAYRTVDAGNMEWGE